MAIFKIEASEIVYYSFDVEAHSLIEAQEMLRQGEFETGEPIDGDNFEILDIYESATP